MHKIISQLFPLVFFITLSASSVIADIAAPNEFMILYSNNVNGETEPCG